MRKQLLFFFLLVALQYGTCLNEHKKSHATYLIVYAPINFPLQFLCTSGTQKISCDLRYSLCPYKISITILCTTSTQKISCDIRYSLCPYESITILCTSGTQKILYNFTHALHVITDFEYIGTLPLSYMLLTLLRLTTKKNYKSYSLVMKPVGPYRNIKHVALFSQADTKLISSRQIISSCQVRSYKFLLSL